MSSQLVMVSGVVSIILSIVLLIAGKPQLGALFGKVGDAVMDACITYLTITVCSFPALAVYNSCSSLFEYGKDKSYHVCIPADEFHQYHRQRNRCVGIESGVAGVAVSSLVLRTVAVAILLALSFNPRQEIYIQVKQIFRVQKDMIRKMLHMAVPNAIENGMLDALKVAFSGVFCDTWYLDEPWSGWSGTCNGYRLGCPVSVDCPAASWIWICVGDTFHFWNLGTIFVKAESIGRILRNAVF